MPTRTSLHGLQRQARVRRAFRDPVCTRQKLPSKWASVQGCLRAAFAGLKLRERARAKPTKPFHQKCETVAVFLEHCREFQPYSAARLYVAHDRFGPDLPFFDKKMKDGLRSQSSGLPCLKKEASGA